MCTESWTSQNYPRDGSAYYRIGGFGNGYYPMTVIIGKGGKVYWNSNEHEFRTAMRKAIDEMTGVFIRNPISDISLIFGADKQIDVSNVFEDLDARDVTVTIENISHPEALSLSIENNILTVTAGSVYEGEVRVRVRGTAGESYEFADFAINIYDPVNYTIENFETGDFSFIPWQFSGNAEWMIDQDIYFEGSFSARSGEISPYQTSEIFVETEYAIKGMISFYSMVSVEAKDDSLKFYINDIEMSSRSGNTAWQNENYPLEPGLHTFRWAYRKGRGTINKSQDSAWIDNIVFEGGRLTSINERKIPDGVILYQNYPNPFNPETDIKFELPGSGRVKLSVYNYKGERVAVIFDGSLDSGLHRMRFRADHLPSGVYYYRLESAESDAVKKMILLK